MYIIVNPLKDCKDRKKSYLCIQPSCYNILLACSQDKQLTGLQVRRLNSIISHVVNPKITWKLGWTSVLANWFYLKESKLLISLWQKVIMQSGNLQFAIWPTNVRLLLSQRNWRYGHYLPWCLYFKEMVLSPWERNPGSESWKELY